MGQFSVTFSYLTGSDLSDIQQSSTKPIKKQQAKPQKR